VLARAEWQDPEIRRGADVRQRGPRGQRHSRQPVRAGRRPLADALGGSAAASPASPATGCSPTCRAPRWRSSAPPKSATPTRFFSATRCAVSFRCAGSACASGRATMPSRRCALAGGAQPAFSTEEH
jgi:hypothetical protein